jgi:hypothetical protein
MSLCEAPGRNRRGLERLRSGRSTKVAGAPGRAPKHACGATMQSP